MVNLTDADASALLLRLLVNKESGPEGPGFGLPPEGDSMVFPLLRQSTGVMEWWSTVKYQIPSTKLQGVRCRVSGVRKKKQKN
jgi:hypothetical protein